jgi:D-alanyl-D-alanine carboxypeptidase
MTTAGGEKLAFSIMVNNYPRDLDPRSLCIDPIVVLLAAFAGKATDTTDGTGIH